MKCNKCQAEKPITDYYKADRTCKECRKAIVRQNRLKNLDYYREFDQKRANDPNRVQARKKYAQTEEGKAAKLRAMKAYHDRYPLKKAAHIITRNAIRDGKLVKPQAYESCGSQHKIEAHHDNYNYPLSVRWLCEKCHKEWHRHNEPVY
jgi:hypothetical protein